MRQIHGVGDIQLHGLTERYVCTESVDTLGVWFTNRKLANEYTVNNHSN